MYSPKFTVILISVVFSVELNTQKSKNIVQCCCIAVVDYVEIKVLTSG